KAHRLEALLRFAPRARPHHSFHYHSRKVRAGTASAPLPVVLRWRGASQGPIVSPGLQSERRQLGRRRGRGALAFPPREAPPAYRGDRPPGAASSRCATCSPQEGLILSRLELSRRRTARLSMENKCTISLRRFRGLKTLSNAHSP